jgi:hypothetical protein
MGIRFYCPNGHKLHVKSFLAGKRGICPHCGVPVDIPYTSTRPSSKELRLAGQAGTGEPPRSAGNVGEQRPAVGAPSVLGRETQLKAASSPETQLAPGPGGKAVETPRVSPVLAAPAGSANLEAGVAAVEVLHAPSSGDRSPTRTFAPSAPTRVGRNIFEPLDEDPNAVWYVMPASGGRYGPASAAVMRTWLMEGRIGLDTLVWRSGWPDWRSAEEVFPNLARFLDSLATRLASTSVQPGGPAVASPLKLGPTGSQGGSEPGQTVKSFLIPLVVAIVIGGISIATIILLLLAKNLGS